MKIRSGLLRGFKWNVSVPDGRYILGTYERQLAEIVRLEVASGKQFVDIGANAGYFSLLASKSGRPDQRHVAIEPFPVNISLLNSHLKENKIDNVWVHQLAIADKIGVVEFSDSGNLAANTYKTESPVFNSKTIRVNAVNLDVFAKDNALNGNCFIKIDVEGAELDVLKGGENYLKENLPKLLLATHDCHVPGVKKACLALIQELGYDYELVEDEKIEDQKDFLCFKP